jgi:sugar phosphate isomerase/epimerase
MLLGYNTNGLAHHELHAAIELLAEIGYRGVAITLDHGALNPYGEGFERELANTAQLLAKHELRCVIETGARFLLDPRTKHEPTLVSANSSARERRIDLLSRAIDIAAALNADCVSLWSGAVRDGAGDREAFSRLVEGLTAVVEHAQRRNVMLAFEPEPGMLIDTLARYENLVEELTGRRVESTRLALTIDIGHLHCQGEVPIADQIRLHGGRLVNVHIDDGRAGRHEHLMFGEGEIDFPPVIAALAKIGYAGLLSVELSRHSHEGPSAAQRAYNFLQPLIRMSGVRCQVSDTRHPTPET